MGPPYIDPEAHGFMQPYGAASHSEQRQEPQRYMRHDSPMETRRPALHRPSSLPDHDVPQQIVALPARELPQPSTVTTSAADPRQPVPFNMTDTPANSNNNTDDEATSGFQFVTFDHPEKLKDKDQMRSNRQFVMHNWLRKESRKGQALRDARVSGHKRRRLDLGSAERPAVTRNTSAPSYIFDSNLTPASSVYSTASSHGDSDGESGPLAPTSGPKLKLPQRPSSTSAVGGTLDWTGFASDQDPYVFLNSSSEDLLPRGQATTAPSVNAFPYSLASESGPGRQELFPESSLPPNAPAGQVAPEITISECASATTRGGETDRQGAFDDTVSQQASTRARLLPLGSSSTVGRVQPTSALPATHPVSNALIRRSSSSPTQNAYLAFPASFIPEPGRARMNTFNAWPQFSNPRLVVEKLKYECNKHFGSQAMGTNWVPAITGAPHAFLSTICIYGAYDESFHGNSDEGRRSNGVERILIENEVISMINRCISSPVHQTSDATLIAVLHLLNSLVMTSGQGVLREHAIGLTKMVNLRGGLNRLGVRGEMATLITSTVLMIAVLGEVAPPEMYDRYVRARDLRPASGERRWWPESPFFCEPNFATGAGNLGAILDAVRELAECLRASRGYDGERERVAQIAARIAAFEPAAEEGFATSTGESARFEAVRLTSRLFVDAVMARRPLSHCATTQASSPVIQITQALKRTNLDDCWGAQAGILFWITLVAGAAASRSMPEDDLAVPVTAEERARRWLAAVAVRCEILLAFEYGDAVLGTLWRMADIQRLLARGPSPHSGRTPGGQVQGAFGPPRALHWA